jgi:hypothetical protein
MKDGVHAETSLDRLQNKLRGVGSLMLREQLPERMRLRMARALHNALNDPMFKEIDTKIVFAAFFTRGEISDARTKMPQLQQGEPK